MLELYHFAFSTCSQKVRLVLAEKQLSYESHEVDIIGGAQHDPAYIRLNPMHVVPTLVDDGNVLIESTLINEYLDDAYPQIPMRPAAPVARHALRLITKLLDDRVHAATGVVTFALGPRNLILEQPEEVREANLAAIPDPTAREARRSVIQNGVNAPEFAGALHKMIGLLDRAESVLQSQPWLSGESFGLADAAVIPYVLRLDHLAMTPLLSAEARPSLADWYARIQTRPSFQTAVTDWAPAEVVALLRAQGEAEWPQIEPLTRSQGNR